MYKIVSIVFDFVLAVTIGLFVCSFAYPKERKSLEQKLISYGFVIPYGAVLFTPTVFINSGIWGQCDVIYSTFVILALYKLYHKKYLPAFILLGVGFAFKLQAVFVLPLFLYVFPLFFLFCAPLGLRMCAVIWLLRCTKCYRLS